MEMNLSDVGKAKLIILPILEEHLAERKRQLRILEHVNHSDMVREDLNKMIDDCIKDIIHLEETIKKIKEEYERDN